MVAVKFTGAVEEAVGDWERVSRFFDTFVTVVPVGIPGPEMGVPTMGVISEEASVTVLLLLMMYPSQFTVEIDEADAGFERVTVWVLDAVTVVPAGIPGPVMGEPTSILVPPGDRVTAFLPIVVRAFTETVLVEAAVVALDRVTLDPETE